MNVVIITEEDVFYVYEFFKSFFSIARDAPYNIRAITISPPFNKKSTIALMKQMYGFFGPVHFIRMGLLYTLKRLSGKTIGSLATHHGIQRWDTEKVNDPVYIERITKNSIDCIVSVAAPQIFKSALLTAPPRGCINSHSALLPENKGMMPVFWGMYKGDKQIGVTIHYMAEALDAGEIIHQVPVDVGSESLHEMILKTKRLSARLVDQTLREIENGTVKSRPMPPGGSYQTFPTPSEVAEFKKRGNKLF
jgi:methionyl-tRNA formyltransferase